VICLGFDLGSRESSWGLVEAKGVGQSCSITFLAKGTCDSTEAGFTKLFDSLSYPPDVIGIEALTPEDEPKSGYAFGATSQRGGGQSVVRHLMLTNRVNGELVVLARRRARVVEFTAGKVRGMVVGKHNAKNPLVEEGVKRYVRGLPRQTSNHVRDALLLCVAVAWKVTSERKASR
jgi:Holliday junction resolvasome RuvABC endonuclease subunit